MYMSCAICSNTIISIRWWYSWVDNRSLTRRWRVLVIFILVFMISVLKNLIACGLGHMIACKIILVKTKIIDVYLVLSKNSLVRKSGILLLEPLIYSISKSKIDNKACHLAKICLLAIFWTSFSKIYLADLQSIRTKNFWLRISSWNLIFYWTPSCPY